MRASFSILEAKPQQKGAFQSIAFAGVSCFQTRTSRMNRKTSVGVKLRLDENEDEEGKIGNLQSQIVNKKPRPCRVHRLSFEHVLQHVELAGLLSTSSEGMSATAATTLLDRLTTVQGLVANHEQGRVNLRPLTKDHHRRFPPY